MLLRHDDSEVLEMWMKHILWGGHDDSIQIHNEKLFDEVLFSASDKLERNSKNSNKDVKRVDELMEFDSIHLNQLNECVAMYFRKLGQRIWNNEKEKNEQINWYVQVRALKSINCNAWRMMHSGFTTKKENYDSNQTFFMRSHKHQQHTHTTTDSNFSNDRNDEEITLLFTLL